MIIGGRGSGVGGRGSGIGDRGSGVGGRGSGVGEELRISLFFPRSPTPDPRPPIPDPSLTIHPATGRRPSSKDGASVVGATSIVVQRVAQLPERSFLPVTFDRIGPLALQWQRH